MDPNSLLNPRFNTRAVSLEPTADEAAKQAASTGVYWIGQDGNVWFKTSSGTKNMGKPTNVHPYGFDSEMFSASATRIADPLAPNNTNSTNVQYTDGGGIVYPDLSGAIAMLEQNIKELDPIYQAKIKKAIENYNIAEKERQAAYDSTKAASDASGVTNDQTVLQDRNAINKNARMAQEDILSILGALGMTGSTTQKAIGSIADKSNEGLNTSNYQYGKNKQNILQSWNDYVGQDANQRKQLVDAREYEKAQAGIEKASAEKDYLSQIASNKVNMGQFDTSDILARMAGAGKQIAELSNVPRTYTGEKATYKAPAISALLGQNMARFDVKTNKGPTRSAPKLIKVNEQTANGDKYGLM